MAPPVRRRRPGHRTAPHPRRDTVHRPTGPLAATERTTRRAAAPHTSRRRTGRLAGLTAALAAVVGLSTLTGPGAHAAADNPYERGPAPTESSIEALRGPYAVSQTSVSRLAVTGFGGGTIYYPHDRRRRRPATEVGGGTFGAIAISPGFTALESSISWLGPRLASQGFVVFTIDTNTTVDQPDSRGDQLLAALDYLTQRSSVRNRVDSGRLGVMGHSMGGGGSLEAAKDRPSLQAAIPLTPWNLDKTWPELRTPRSSSAPTATPSPRRQPRRALLQQPALVPGPGLPGAQQRHPLHPELVEHDDREVQHFLAEALHRQRHPLRAVPLPAAPAEPDDRGVAGQLPAHLLIRGARHTGARPPVAVRVRRGPPPALCARTDRGAPPALGGVTPRTVRGTGKAPDGTAVARSRTFGRTPSARPYA